MARSHRQPLVIPVEIYDAMISHCIKGSPLACFGILAGIEPQASAIYPLRNAAESPVRYESDPDDLLRAYLDLRERGLAIVAIYHCLPWNAAVPGPTDLRENYYGDIPRVIVSLGDFPTVRVWRLTTRYCDELDWGFSRVISAPSPGTPSQTLSGPMSNEAPVCRSRPLSSDRSFPGCSGGGARPRGSRSATFEISHLGNPNRCGTLHWTVLESEILHTSEGGTVSVDSDGNRPATVLALGRFGIRVVIRSNRRDHV